MQPDLDLVSAALGATPRSFEPLNQGGYTRSLSWRVKTSNGSAFVKQAEDEGSLHMLRREAVVYQHVHGSFLPGYRGFADNGTRAVLAIELLADAHWPPPYPADVAPLFHALEEVAAAAAPAALPSWKHRPSRWERVAADVLPLIGLGLCSEAWLERALPTLIAAERDAVDVGDDLVHNDVYSGNVAFVGHRSVLVDWGAAIKGSRWVDVAFAVLSVRVEGGELPPVDLPNEGAYAASLAGHFALEAPLPLPEWTPPDSTLREDMIGDLDHALRWAAETLELPLALDEHMFYSACVRVEYREEPCKTALNRVRGMPFAWSLNPYMGCVHRCTFCYVRAFEQRAERPSGEAYGVSIRVKVNVADVLRTELARKSWRGEAVAIGAATDPYQPAEGRYRLTRSCLEALAGAANPFHIVTRGPLIVRDVEVLAEAAVRARVSVSFSVPTLDEDVWRRTEPGTAPPRQRLRARSVLREAGIDAGVAVAPVLPGISDGPHQLSEVVQAAREAGATHCWASVVNLRPGTREHFLSHLADDWPDLPPFYERLYGTRAYPPRATEKRVRDLVAAARRERPFRRGRRLKPREPALQLELL